jgi:large conductance mechanosensitive channel
MKSGTESGPYASLEVAQKAGAVTVNYGVFFNAVISFLIVAFAVFMLVKGINRLHRKQAAPPAAPTTKECPQCCSTIPIKAMRCPNCTSQLA